MDKRERSGAGSQKLEQEFRGFFDRHADALRRALTRAGLQPAAKDSDPAGYGVEIHVAPLDDKDMAAGYASVDVTLSGHQPDALPEEEKRLVLWFVRLGHGENWKLVTRNGYLDWLLLGETYPTQGVGPQLHVAIQEAFPETMEHRDWFERRG